MTTVNDFNTALSKQLKGTFTAAEIKQFASTIAQLQGLGIHCDDVFPLGRPAQIDALQVRGSVQLAEIAKLANLLRDPELVREIRLFPRGIIAPDALRIHAVLPR